MPQTRHPPTCPAHKGEEEGFLRYTDVLPWTGDVAPHYGTLRAALETTGITIAPLDLMIAARALAVDATLVSADKALGRIGIVRVEDWSA